MVVNGRGGSQRFSSGDLSSHHSGVYWERVPEKKTLSSKKCHFLLWPLNPTVLLVPLGNISNLRVRFSFENDFTISNDNDVVYPWRPVHTGPGSVFRA